MMTCLCVWQCLQWEEGSMAEMNNPDFCSQQDEHCLAEKRRRGRGMCKGELSRKESSTSKPLSLLWMGNG